MEIENKKVISMPKHFWIHHANNRQRKYIFYQNIVIDCFSVLKIHPQISEIIQRYAFKDISGYFKDKYQQFKKYKIGEVDLKDDKQYIALNKRYQKIMTKIPQENTKFLKIVESIFQNYKQNKSQFDFQGQNLKQTLDDIPPIIIKNLIVNFKPNN